MPSRISNLAGFTTSLSSTTELNLGIITATSNTITDTSTFGEVQIYSGIITSTSGVVTYYGDGSQLTGISAGSSVTDDTSTDSSFYPLFTNVTSGILSTSDISTTKLSFNPSSATLNIGSGTTITSNNISIAGTITAQGISIPLGLG